MKLNSLTLAATVAFAALALPAQAATYAYSGDTTGGPTFNRPFTLTALSGVGTEIEYSALTFSVSTSGSYAFSSEAIGGWDNFIILYSGSFNPASALTNAVALNDDDPANGIGFSALSFSLTAGSNYVLVTTGYEDGFDFGAFSNTITGPGSITPVPEPSSYALFALGLAGFAALKRRKMH